MSSQSKEGYIPGVCNIGPEEREARKKWAIGLFIILALTVAVLQILTVNHLWRLLTFLPAAGFAIGFQQWYYRFCVAYGAKGFYNFGTIGKVLKANSKDDLQKDLAKVRQMFIAGFIFGVVFAIAYYFLPV